jgi:hypothetical protein
MPSRPTDGEKVDVTKMARRGKEILPDMSAYNNVRGLVPAAKER